MKTIKILTSKKDIKKSLENTGIDYNSIPKKNSIIRLENARKTIIKGKISHYERGQNKWHWRPLFHAINVDSKGNLYIGTSY